MKYSVNFSENSKTHFHEAKLSFDDGKTVKFVGPKISLIEDCIKSYLKRNYKDAEPTNNNM